MSYPALPADAVSRVRAFLMAYQQSLCANMDKLDGKHVFCKIPGFGPMVAVASAVLWTMDKFSNVQV